MNKLTRLLAFVFILAAASFAMAQQSGVSQLPVQKFRMATKDEVARLHRDTADNSDRSDVSRNRPDMTAPLWVISASGNSNRGLTAMACNALPIPVDTTIVGTVTGPDGVQKDRNMFYIIQEVEAGTFCYPLDTEHKYDWNEPSGTVIYDMWSYDTNSGNLISRSTAKKMINRYWSGDVTTTKLIDAGTTQLQNGVLYIRLEGRIAMNGPVSAMVKDGETDVWYPKPVPPQAITRVGQVLRINMSMVEFPTTPYGEVVVIVANRQGLSDQYTVRVRP